MKVIKETTHIDECECIYCGHMFDGRNACNANMDKTSVECPVCGNKMQVIISCEFTCREWED